jgi:hypothetical protein
MMKRRKGCALKYAVEIVGSTASRSCFIAAILRSSPPPQGNERPMFRNRTPNCLKD